MKPKKYSTEFVIASGTNFKPILGVSAVQAMTLITINGENFVAQITGNIAIVQSHTKEQLKQQSDLV